MQKKIRRVVTGHNAGGKSIFIMDGPSPHVFNRGTGSVVVTDLWETHGTPADNRGNEDSISGPFRLQPPKNGSVLRIIEYPPDKQRVPALAHERNASADGSGRYEALDRGNPRHPGFHKTSSIDYAIVLSGEIVAMMDEGEALLKTGDVLIQRGTIMPGAIGPTNRPIWHSCSLTPRSSAKANRRPINGRRGTPFSPNR
jgi:hypothetical protein